MVAIGDSAFGHVVVGTSRQGASTWAVDAPICPRSMKKWKKKSI